jgi:hypothetical protein
MSSSVVCAACSAQVTQARCEQCGAAVRAGSYRVVKLLAQTPHSRMYVAEDDSGRRVALKELLFAAVPSLEQLEAFEREGRFLEELSHPQIPRFLAAFRDGQGAQVRLYLAQELIEGESLWDRLRAEAFDEAQARDVARQVLEVLGYLHGRSPKVIHRDVKPHNLIVRADGTLLLVDFGAARELASGATHQATLVGTYGYMPPDQLAGTVDETSDLYALGATLMHLLTGRPPDKLITDDLELGAGVSLNVSAEFDKFVRRLAAKSTARRFPSASSAAAAFQALPPLQPRAPRRRSAWLAAGLAGLALLVGAGFVVVRGMGAPAPPVQPRVRAYAWEPKVTVYEVANPASALPPAAALTIGEAVDVDRDPGTCGVDFLPLLAPRVGFVKASEVRTTPPDYDSVLEAARKALGKAQLPETEAEGKRARALRTKEREPLTLLLALYSAQNRPDDATRIEGFQTELGPTPAAPPATPKSEARTGPPPQAGEHWFIGATTLRMRKKPSSDGRVLAELPINTEVEVVDLKDEWAQVRWASSVPSGLEFSFDGALNSESTETVVEGFVAQGYLVREKVDKDWTLSKVQEAQKNNDREEVVRQLARAVAVDPLDRGVQLQLAEAAVATRDYFIAAKAAVAATELALGVPKPLVELRLAYRCRGERARAEWITDTAGVKGAPDDACIENLTPRWCPPCDCSAGGSEESEDEATPDPWESAREAEAERERRLRELDAAFPEGAWLRVRIVGPSRPSPEASRVIVFGATGDGCTNGEAIDTVPVPAPGQDVTIWVQVPSYYDKIYGVTLGKRAADLTAGMSSSDSYCESGWYQRTAAIISTAKDACDACNCGSEEGCSQ